MNAHRMRAIDGNETRSVSLERDVAWENVFAITFPNNWTTEYAMEATCSIYSVSKLSAEMWPDSPANNQRLL